MFDLLDEASASALGITLEEYIDKIERLSIGRMTIVIEALLTEDESKIEKVKRIFKLIK